MREDPDIIRILKKEERLGLLKTQSQDSYEELETPGEVLEDMPDKSISVMKDLVDADNLFSDDKNKTNRILDAISDWICILDKDHRIIYSNTAVEKITGLSQSESIGQNCCKVVHGSEKPLPGCPLEMMLRSHKRESLEIQIPDSDRWVKITVDAVKDKKGNITGVIHIISDITERKQRENELRKFKTIANDARYGSAISDLEGNIIYTNVSFAKMHGYTADELIGKNLSIFHTKEQLENVERLKKKLKQTGSYIGEEVWHKKRDGTVFPTLMNGTLIMDEKRIPLYLSATAIDITNRKKAEEALRESEEKYRNIVELAPDGILIIDLKGKVTSCNTAILGQTGYSKDEIVGKHFTKLPATRLKDIPRYIKIFKDIIRGKILKPFVFKWRHKNGTIRVGEIHIALMKKNGKTTGFQAVLRDITERKKSEELLQESEEKFRNIFENAKDSLVLLDKTGKIIDVNKEAQKTFGGLREELLGKNFLKIGVFSPKEIPKLLKNFRKVLRDKKALLYVQFTNKKDQIIDLECSANLIKLDNKLTGVMVVARDYTERKKIEEKIKKQNIMLKKLDRIKTDFLNVTSHELRTPMASIKGYIQMLLKQTLGNVTPEQKDALNVVLRNTNRLDNLIEDILDISRLESGTMKFIPEKTDIKKMIKEVEKTMQSSADLKNIKINIEIGEEIPELIIDQERIKQVLMNIIDNSIKFSPQDSIINLYTKMEKDNVLFEIQDFGKGIPKNKKKKIFERFYQVDSGMDRTFGGVGLGLTISKGIINVHGGKIWVDSTLGTGSSFKISLPLQSVQNIEDRSKDMDLFILENNK